MRGISTAGTVALWPNNVVPYVVEKYFSEEDRIVIAAVSFFLYITLSHCYNWSLWCSIEESQYGNSMAVGPSYHWL
jgi:hypothetical protein